MRRIALVFSLLLITAGCAMEAERSPEPLVLSVADVFTSDRTQIEAGNSLTDSLFPLFPNPFNRAAGDTTIGITFTVSDTSKVIILIQNPIGEEIVRFRDTTLSPAQYSARWSPVNSAREPLNAGLYFVTLRTSDYISSRMLSIQTN